MVDTTLILKDEVYAIIGAAIEVHRQLGNGFLEAVYEEAMVIESRLRNIPFSTQVHLPIEYKGQTLSKEYIADYIGFDQIIVEFKCNERLTSTDEAQILNYLKASGKKVGLLINFGSRGKLEWKRYIR